MHHSDEIQRSWARALVALEDTDRADLMLKALTDDRPLSCWGQLVRACTTAAVARNLIIEARAQGHEEIARSIIGHDLI